MLSIRLSPAMETELNRLAAIKHTSRTEIVKTALKEHFEKERCAEPAPYLLGKEFFGVADSGEETRSTDYKRRLKEKLHAKHAH